MWILTIILAIIIAFLQSTIAPALSIYGGTIDLILVVTLIFLFHRGVRNSSIFLVASSVVLAVISGLPLIYLVLPNFIIIILYSFLTQRRILSKPSRLLSLLIIFAATILIEAIKMLVMRRLSFSYAAPIFSSSIYNAIIGGTIYYLCNKIHFFLNPQLLRERIKIKAL